MRSRVTGSLFIVAILALCLATEAAAQGTSPTARADGSIIVPITGTTSNRGAFSGLFALQRFESGADGGIVAVGVISGTVTTKKGEVGFDRVDKMGPAWGLVPTVVFFAIQIVLSNWWLQYYQFGPAEWVWRSLTYGRMQPMRKGAVTEVPLSVAAAEPLPS